MADFVNKERPDERDAKEVIERALSIKLVHADKNGEVDYRTDDGHAAVEVTRVTDGRRAAARKALAAPRAGSSEPETPLAACWLVFAPDTQERLNTFNRRVRPLLAQLEAAGVSEFFDQRARIHVLEKGPLSDVYRPLLAAGVERASASPHETTDPAHLHRIITSLGSGGSVGSSDEACALLTNALKQRSDNSAKLEKSGAEERHLFVWIDDDTDFGIARPLSRDAPSWDDGSFAAPSHPPELDPAITRLWVAHEGSRRAWYWDGSAWHELRHI